jgi:hypothetical protein
MGATSLIRADGFFFLFPKAFYPQLSSKAAIIRTACFALLGLDLLKIYHFPREIPNTSRQGKRP